MSFFAFNSIFLHFDFVYFSPLLWNLYQKYIHCIFFIVQLICILIWEDLNVQNDVKNREEKKNYLQQHLEIHSILLKLVSISVGYF